jgi:hypothetical protein
VKISTNFHYYKFDGKKKNKKKPLHCRIKEIGNSLSFFCYFSFFSQQILSYFWEKNWENFEKLFVFVFLLGKV